jgi:hypothetical protein
MRDLERSSIKEEPQWLVWVVTVCGIALALLTLWFGKNSGLSIQAMNRLEYVLFTTAMLGIAFSRVCMNRYERKLKQFRMTYQVYVPGAVGPTKIEQTYKYRTDEFSDGDRKNYVKMQALAYLGIFFLSILFGVSFSLLYQTYWKA